MAALSGRRLGVYELLREISRGGMGAVFLARHVDLGRTVALKTLLAGSSAASEEVLRFHAEARAAAALEHPGIVPIYEVGEFDGQSFYTMKFIEGQSLKSRLAVSPLDPCEAAHMLLRIAEAVAYAHSRGIVHRDLKPANVLIDLDGAPHVTDFGLAKRIEQGSDITGVGQVLGTPSFMPPEQARGLHNQVGPQSDIYSLGAVLYCMLTGRPPFQAATLLETLRQVVDLEPVAPRRLNPLIPEDLELICLKCLEKRTTDRYQTVELLIADLRRYLDGQSVSLRSLTGWEWLKRTLRHGRDDLALRGWSHIIVAFAIIILAAESAVFLLARSGPPYPLGLSVLIRACQFASMGAVLWRGRSSWLTILDTAGRQMLTFWCGFIITCHAAVALMIELHLLRGNGDPLEMLDIYPPLSILSGFLLFVMGSNYWGMCYLLGSVFLCLALLMPLELSWAPLVFGVWWFASLLLIGRHLGTLARHSN